MVPIDYLRGVVSAKRGGPRRVTDKQFYQMCVDRAFPALLAQGVKCGRPVHGTNGVLCMYRNEGKACIVGHLISDENYDKFMDSGAICAMEPPISKAVHNTLGVRFDGGKSFCQRRVFLGTLQALHDHNQPSAWPSIMLQLCNNYRLHPPAVLTTFAYPYAPSEDNPV